MAGDNQYVLVRPDSNPFVEVDLDPTFTDLVSDAYLSVLIFIPSTIKPDVDANPGTKLDLIQSDDFFLGIRNTGGSYFWLSDVSGAGSDFATVDFDQWVQVEVHAIAGSSTYDVKIDGTTYLALNAPFLPATGVNYWAVNALPASAVGDGGGTAADDTIGADELSWSNTNWVSISGAYARWAFDGTDPIGDAAINYPTPPWTFNDDANPANLAITTGGGTNADLAPGQSTGGGSGQGPQGCVTTVTLDGVDVTGVAIEGSATRRLNRPAQATIKIPMDAAIGGPGSRLAIYFGGTLFFHGLVMDCETDGGEDDGYTIYNASDPMELWQWRVVRDDDGDFTKPEVIDTYIYGPQIMEAILKNTEGDSTAQGNPLLSPPITTEGPTFLTFGTFEGGPNQADLTGAPADWPMTIAEIASLLISTGELDLVVTPTDPGGGIMGTIDAFNGDYGQDLSGSVTFSYGTGALNVRAMRWNEDMSTMVNKLQYFLGPRVGTVSDPAGDQHWRANVQSFDPAFNPNVTFIGAWASATAYAQNESVTSGGKIYACLRLHVSSALTQPGAGAQWPKYWALWQVPPGGRSVDATNTPLGPPWTNNQLGEQIYNSRYVSGPGGTGYGVRMQVQIFDGQGDDDPSGSRALYRRLWQIESWLRSVPRSLIHITPIRDYAIGSFDIGDLVGVEAGTQIRGGFSGAQRVYGYTISWDEDGPCELSELQTSADQEAF